MTETRSNSISSPLSPGSAAMIGTGAAATMLGLHRSSINYAVRHGYLTPDNITPSGQMRFYPATIARYATTRRGQRVIGTPPTDAVDDAARSEPAAWLALLRRLATEMAGGTDARDVCRIALEEIRQIKPDLCLAVVVQHDPTDDDPLHATPLASEGVTSGLIDEVRQAGGITEFSFRTVLDSGVMLCCDDTDEATLSAASRWFIEELHIRSYCVLPLKEGARTFGLLILHSTRANAFGGVIKPFLQHVAELLAAAMIQHNRMSKLHDYLKHAGDLMMRGVEEYAVGGVATNERLEQMLVAMARSYCEITHAVTVICTAGPPTPGMAQDERVRDVAEEASRTRRLTNKRWRTAQGSVTCVGTHVPVGGGAFAGMAAAWHEERGDWLADYALLRVFAGACVLALSGLRRVHPSDATAGTQSGAVAP